MKKNQFEHLASHPRPVTRRDFLARGLLAFFGMVFAPNLRHFLRYQPLFGQENTKNLPAFLVFDLAGGAGLPGNFLVGKAGGPEDLLKSYSLLGWNPREQGALDNRFGLPMSTNYSKMREGMLSVMSAEAQAKFRMGSICHFAQDDSSSNPLSALSLVAMTGYQGSDIRSPLGQRTNLSGGNSKVVKEDPSYRPHAVRRLSDLLNAVGLGETFSRFDEKAREAMAKGIRSLSTYQANRLMDSSDAADLRNFVGGQFGEFENQVSNVPNFDPRGDPIFSDVYQINPNSNVTSSEVVAAAMVRASLLRAAGPSVITIGGCDYHDGTQTSGDNKDLEVGVHIGWAVEAAHRLQTPLFIQMITDGGVGASNGSRRWTNDAGDKCMTVLGYYHPDRTPTYFRDEKSIQIGAFTEGQGADRTTLVGENPALAAYASFANWLNINGRLGEMQKFAPGVFSSEQLESVLVFA